MSRTQSSRQPDCWKLHNPLIYRAATSRRERSAALATVDASRDATILALSRSRGAAGGCGASRRQRRWRDDVLWRQAKGRARSRWSPQSGRGQRGRHKRQRIAWFRRANRREQALLVGRYRKPDAAATLGCRQGRRNRRAVDRQNDSRARFSHHSRELSEDNVAACNPFRRQRRSAPRVALWRAKITWRSMIAAIRSARL